MKILFTTISLDAETGGGTAERTRQLARNVKLLGYSSSVFAMKGGNLANDLRASAVPVGVTGSFRIRYEVPLPNWGLLKDAIRSSDIVHVLGYWNLLSVATCYFARTIGKPYVLCAAGEFAGLQNPSLTKRLFHQLFGKSMIAHAAAIIGVTELEREQIMQLIQDETRRIIVIPNGVVLPAPAAASSPYSQFSPFFLFMGRLAEIKGPDLLIEAFASIANEYPSVHLLLAGPDFGMKAALQSRVRELGMESRIFFLGYLDEIARTDAYQAASLVVVPSRNEAMSLVAVEAAAAGTPVLLTDQCGFDERVLEGGGYIVSASFEGLRDGLRKLLDDPSKLPAMGDTLRASVLRTYAWPTIAKTFVRALDSLLTQENPISPNDAQRR